MLLFDVVVVVVRLIGEFKKKKKEETTVKSTRTQLVSWLIKCTMKNVQDSSIWGIRRTLQMMMVAQEEIKPVELELMAISFIQFSFSVCACDWKKIKTKNKKIYRF